MAFDHPFDRLASRQSSSRGMASRSAGTDDDRLAELFGLERDQAAARCAREAESFAIAHQEDLAVEQPVIEILAGSHHVAEFAMLPVLTPTRHPGSKMNIRRDGAISSS